MGNTNKTESDNIFKKRGWSGRTFLKQLDLQLLVLPGIILLLVFAYYPMYGLQIAFKDFSFTKGFFGSNWVGLKYFNEIIKDPIMMRALYNTVAMSFLRLILLFPAPIIFALALNELKDGYFKRVIQTISYFPYFIAWAIVAMMVQQWLSTDSGFINAILVNTGLLKEPFLFLGSAKAFWWITIVLEFWKGLGFSTIIYLAAISGVEQEQYESATIDGARRFDKIWFITLPSILGTIMILFILSVSQIINGNFDISFLLSNDMNAVRSEILQTYTYKVGIAMGRYSYGTAVGLASSLVSMILLVICNNTVSRLTGESLF